MDSNNKSTILVIEDTTDNIDIINSMLKNKYNIKVAKSGKIGLKILESLQNNLPDIILLDVIMPEMDGFDTCKLIKENENTKDIPIIFLTAKNEVNDVIKGFDLGAVDYISKPFNSTELQKRIKTHLDLKHSKDIILKQSSEYKELIQMMCHDLGNPIGFILGVINLAKDDSTIYNKMEDHMNTAMSNAMDLIDIVRKMRTIDEGKIKFEINPINLYDSIQESITILSQKLLKKNIEIEVVIEKDIHVLVEKTSFINSVINNLLSNAIKFSFENSKIIIKAEIEHDNILLSIQDFGIGMSDKLISNIFNFNKTISREGTLGEKGTGFGMPLVRKFIKLYDGDIFIKSIEKKENSNSQGTIITLKLIKKQ